MKDYELTLVIKSDTTEDAQNSLLQGIAALIQEKGGILEKQDVKKNVFLPSAIQKQNTAVIAVLKFKAPQEIIEGLEKRVKEEKTVLRAMITKFQKPKAVRIPSFSPLRHPVAAQTEEGQKMSAEEIDKQLEEIFKEPNA
ncbi:MAG: 30S ribosomal protein S6 [Candidatus Wildermuthbacteria bacterium]|nr:30S ribosomal protein S6 [Candidatus Wildermuthbacteria bacterium]